MNDTTKYNKKFSYFINTGKKDNEIDNSQRYNSTMIVAQKLRHENKTPNKLCSKSKLKLKSKMKMNLFTFNKLLVNEKSKKSKDNNNNTDAQSRLDFATSPTKAKKPKSVIHQSNIPNILQSFHRDRNQSCHRTYEELKSRSYEELTKPFLDQIFKTVWLKTDGKNCSEIVSDLDQSLALISKFEQQPLVSVSKSELESDTETEIETNRPKSDSQSKIKMTGIIIDYYKAKSPNLFVPQFCSMAKKCLIVPNAGADLSRKSEAVSINYFYDRFGATEFVLENDIEYVWAYKMVDFVCTVYNRRVGCSVTRAMHWRDPDMFTENIAIELLQKKLSGLLMARGNIGEAHAFNTCFLHILCQNQKIADTLNQVYSQVIKNDESRTFEEVIIIATVFTQSFIYSNDRHDLDNIPISIS